MVTREKETISATLLDANHKSNDLVNRRGIVARCAGALGNDNLTRAPLCVPGIRRTGYGVGFDFDIRTQIRYQLRETCLTL